MYDVCVIGGGPAGMTAALYSARAGRKTLLMEEKTYGGQMAETSVIENMPGSPDAEGWELTMRFAQQVEQMQVETCYEKAVHLTPQPDGIQIETAGGKTYGAKKVILAMGIRRRRLNVPGEDRLAGKGVGWCAVCDGAFFRDKEVCIVGGGNTALDDALYLAKLCKKVRLIHRRDAFRASAGTVERVLKNEIIEFIPNTQVKEILGENKVTAVKLVDKDGKETELTTDAVFVAVGLKPDNGIFAPEVALSEDGYILADESCKTNVEGVFAAGDTRTKLLRQLVTAAADGAVAATQAANYLMEN